MHPARGFLRAGASATIRPDGTPARPHAPGGEATMGTWLLGNNVVTQIGIVVRDVELLENDGKGKE